MGQFEDLGRARWRGSLWAAYLALAVGPLGLNGCGGPEGPQTASLNAGTFTVPVADALARSARAANYTLNATASIEALGIRAELNIANGVAVGSLPNVPTGTHTIKLRFFTRDASAGAVDLAVAERAFAVSAQSATAAFTADDYQLIDNDGDRYSNALELEYGTDLSNAASKPATARAFFTSVWGSGNLGSWPQAGGATGVAAGDAICQNLATAAGLGGTYRAWLSDDTSDAYCRIHNLTGKVASKCGQVSLPATVGPWIRADGQAFAANAAGLTGKGALFRPLNRTEKGVATDSIAWTGTTPAGVRAADPKHTCNNWTSAGTADRGLFGTSVGTVGTWTQADAGECSVNMALYCLEARGGAPLPDVRERGLKVFQSSEQGNGNLATWASSGGKAGLEGGDAVCQALAARAGYANANRFKAWLSSDSLNAIDRLTQNGPWTRPDGVLFAASKADLAGILMPTSLALTETGLYRDLEVWTGTNFRGLREQGNNCSNWTSGASTAAGISGGSYTSGDRWTNTDEWAKRNCAATLPLYCFED